MSIGLEDLEDLKQDFRQAFEKVAEVSTHIRITKIMHALNDSQAIVSTVQ